MSSENRPPWQRMLKNQSEPTEELEVQRLTGEVVDVTESMHSKLKKR